MLRTSMPAPNQVNQCCVPGDVPSYVQWTRVRAFNLSVLVSTPSLVIHCPSMSLLSCSNSNSNSTELLDVRSIMRAGPAMTAMTAKTAKTATTATSTLINAGGGGPHGPSLVEPRSLLT